MTAMTTYYQARAGEYEAIYAKPERQADLAALKLWLAAESAGRHVLEIACGTGWWTAVAAPSAAAILATDYNSGPLEIARAKGLGPKVTFAQADAYALGPDLGTFDCGMAHFWWSHVPRGQQRAFLAHFAARLQSGARLLMIDNSYVPGSSTPISRTDHDGNTWQRRQLNSGEDHEVLKNFPTSAELKTAFGSISRAVEVRELTHYWALTADLI